MDERAGRERPDSRHVTEFAASITEADLALALVDLRDLAILAISNAWLSQLDLPVESVIGRPGTDFVRFEERGAAREALEALRRNVIDLYVGHLELRSPLGSEPMTTAWLRRFELDGRVLALVQGAPASDDEFSPWSKHFGPEPATMAIGTIDPDCIVTAMSRDVTRLLGLRPQDIVGQSLLDNVARRDVRPLLNAQRQLKHHSVGIPIHLRNSKGQWVPLCCLLTTLEGNPDRCFLLAPVLDAREQRSRVSELEQDLWQIGSIVEASGVLQHFGPMRDMTALPQINNLTTRQWEVLTRLVRGERVPTIAAELHLSQSTVRNHLSVIFKHFGVRSQPELLRVIEAAPTARPA